MRCCYQRPGMNKPQLMHSRLFMFHYRKRSISCPKSLKLIIIRKDEKIRENILERLHQIMNLRLSKCDGQSRKFASERKTSEYLKILNQRGSPKLTKNLYIVPLPSQGTNPWVYNRGRQGLIFKIKLNPEIRLNKILRPNLQVKQLIRYRFWLSQITHSLRE
jgi:hypothetical protein